MSVLVELVCKAEDKVIATIRVERSLDAVAMSTGVTGKDLRRFPLRIQDGVQTYCVECKNALYFRDESGNMLAAMPGSVEFVEDEQEIKARDRIARERAIQEAKAFHMLWSAT